MTPEELAHRIGLPPGLRHLELALTHPSFANELRQPARLDNQRLEFLGDAVLQLCVSELLMARFPSADEGTLSRLRSALVNAEALAGWARTVALGDALRVGRGALATGALEQTNVLADAVEAVLGAVFLELGLSHAGRLTEAIVGPNLELLEAGVALHHDAKGELQARLQAAGQGPPRYRVVEEGGRDHDRYFRVALEIEGARLVEGRGRSKKQAEQDAARQALEAFEQPPAERAGPPRAEET